MAVVFEIQQYKIAVLTCQIEICNDCITNKTESAAWKLLHITRIQLVADISADSPHHFLVFCHIFTSFWRKIKVDSVLESGESRVSI
jgi:hypothetical protein